MDLKDDDVSGPDAVPESVAGAGIGIDVGSSGSCVNERVDDDDDKVESKNTVVEVNETQRASWSPCANSASPCVSGGSAPRKGYGLKKWKRIRRVDGITNFSHSLGTDKKRVFPDNQLPQSAKETQGTDIAGPVNILEKNLGGSNYIPAQASSSIASVVGAVSDNSEGQSSKSSTAASAPRLGFDMPSISPFSWEKNIPKNLSGKGLSNASQRGQPVGVIADPSKKFRGERVKYEKENSHSSMESDSRSSNFFFMQASNGRLSEASINYNGESDEDIPGERQSTVDQAASNPANAQATEDISLLNLGDDLSGEARKENGENHQRRDPLVDAVLTLNSVQEALEKELQQFREMGRESYFTCPDPASSVNSSDYVNHEESTQNASGSLDTDAKMRSLESQTEEARDALRVKDSQVSELEASLISTSLHEGDTKYKAQALENTEKLEAELEILFEHIIYAEIRNLVIASALQEAKKPAACNPRILLAEQKALVDEQSHLGNRIKQAECKVVKINRQAKEVEEIVETGEDLSLQKSRISKLAWHSLFQILMLLVVLWSLYSQLVTDSGAVVPT